MRINLVSTEATLIQNMSHANANNDLLSRAETAIREAATNTAMGQSKSFTTFCNFLEELLVPATLVQHDATLALVGDIQTDMARLAELFIMGPLVDTDVLQRIITACRQAAERFDQLANACHFSPGTAAALRALAAAARAQANLFQHFLDMAMAYLHDGSLYATSTGLLANVRSALNALNAAVINPSTGTWDLSGVDLSWVPDLNDAAYWKQHNQLVLNQYFTFDADGNITGIRPDALGTLSELGGNAIKAITSDDPNAFPTFMNGLSTDEKYLLIYLGTKLPRPLYQIGCAMAEGASRKLGGNIAPWGVALFEGVSDFCRAHNLPNPVSVIGSFSADNGQFFSENSSLSIQRKAGYSDFIELWGPALGMDIDTTVTTFTYEGKEYRLQTWNGGYGEGLAYGGEIGLYSRDAPTSSADAYHTMLPHDITQQLATLTSDQINGICETYGTVSGNEQPDITIRGRSDDGSLSLQRDAGQTYWNFTAQPLPDNKIGEEVHLDIHGDLDFSKDPGLGKATYDALRKDGIDATYDAEHDTVHVNWQ